MTDLLAAIASEPTAIPLLGVFLAALGMYPVGLFLACKKCCDICRACCRDTVSQIVIDFELEGTGTQLVKETPWIRGLAQGGAGEVDGTHIMPYFILEGASSGARVLAAMQTTDDFRIQIRGSGQYVTFFGMGADQFENGEAITVTPHPAVNQIEAPDLTAQVSGCSAPAIVGNRGKWEKPGWINAGPMDPFVPADPRDLTVECQADEGSVIFDVADHDNRPPEDECDSCVATVSRVMPHPASFPLDECWANGTPGNFSIELSQIAVSVPLMAFGRNRCQRQLTASAEVLWTGITSNLGSLSNQSFCQKTTTYTLDSSTQDCSPLDNWESETIEVGPNEYSEQLVTLSATACYGSGFAGIATEPIGIPGVADGPLAAVEVTQPGSGYAVLGRIEPSEITVSSVNGGDAELVVTFAETVDDCGRPVWEIDTVEIGDDGGSGYVHDETLLIGVTAPVFEHEPAVLKVVSVREEPSVTMSTFTGTGAALTVTWTETVGPPSTWSINAITVDEGGIGYHYGQYASFAPATSDDFVIVYGTGTIQTGVSEPTLAMSGDRVNAGPPASLADLSATLASNGGSPETWRIAAVTIANGGAGYVVGDQLSVVVSPGDVQVTAAVVTVASVGSSGEIISVSISTPGEYYNDDGVIASITVDEPGQYWRATGEIESVTVEDGGAYYEEDSTEPALVSDITINIGQKPPSDGADASISAVVDDNPASETFGQITGLTIDSGGTDYLAIWFQDGPCAGPGGMYREGHSFCGASAHEVVGGFIGPFRFFRGCPDYTYSISIEPA